MKPQLAFLFSTIICIHFSYAQDSLAVTALPVPRSGIELLVDLGTVANVTSKNRTKYEGAISLLLKNHLRFEIEGGIASSKPKFPYDNGTYESEGVYYRLGVDYSRDLTIKSQIFIGFRYAASSFNDKFSYLIASDLWGDRNVSDSRDNLKANWGEVILGSEAQLSHLQDRFLNRISIGWKVRYKKLIEYDEQPTPDIFSIPGYGRTVNRPSWGLNLYLRFKIT